MSRPAFVAVEGGKLHRNPAYEDCNIDDAAVINRYAAIEDVPKVFKRAPCSKCEPLLEVPPKRVGKKRVYPVGGGPVEKPKDEALDKSEEPPT